MAAELVVAVVVVAFEGSFFERAVHAFDLAVGPGMVGLSEAVLNVVLGADFIEDVLGGTSGGAPVGKLGAIVGEHGVQFVGDCGDQFAQELSGGAAVGLGLRASEGELRGSVNGHKQIELAFSSTQWGDIDVEVAEGVAFEALAGGPVGSRLGQPADAVALQAAVQ